MFADANFHYNASVNVYTIKARKSKFYSTSIKKMALTLKKIVYKIGGCLTFNGVYAALSEI